MRYERSTGTPRDVMLRWRALPGDHYVLVLQDAQGGGANARVWLNGLELVVPEAIAGASRPEARIPIVLRDNNEVVVRQTGRPGSTLTLRVEGTAPTVPLPFATTMIPVPIDPASFGKAPGEIFVSSAFSAPQSPDGTSGWVKVSASAAQLLTITDIDGNVRGYTISLPGAAGVVPATASASALALMFMTPGILSQGATASARVATIEQLSCYASLQGDVASALRAHTLAQTIADPRITQEFEGCIQQFFANNAHFAAAAIPQPVVQSANGLFFARAAAGDLQTLNVTNKAWRYVTVYRRDLLGADATPAQAVMQVDGATSLSFGSFFGGTFDDPGTASDDSFMSSDRPTAEYWAVGLGLLAPDPGRPTDVPPPTWAAAHTAWDYVIVPIASSMIPGLESLTDIVNEVEGARSLTTLIAATTRSEASAAALDLTREVFTDVVTDGTIASHFGLQAASWLGTLATGVDRGIATFNLIGFANTLANVSPATLFDIPRNVAYQLMPVSAVTFSGSPTQQVTLQTRILDIAGDPVRNATVTFSIPAAAGTLSSTQTTTDASGLATTTWTLGGPGEYTATAEAHRGAIPIIGSPLQFTVTVVNPIVLRYSDDFSHGLANWVNPTGQGNWWIENAELLGDYDITCGSIGCSQADLLLVNNLQPGDTNWRIEVQGGLTQAYCCYNGGFMVNYAKFVIWGSATEKMAIDIGNGWQGLQPPATSTTVFAGAQTYSPWTPAGSALITVPQWSTSQWQTGAVERHGDEYRLYFNGQLVTTLTKHFSVPPKVGLHTYGGVRLDNFKLFTLP